MDDCKNKVEWKCQTMKTHFEPLLRENYSYQSEASLELFSTPFESSISNLEQQLAQRERQYEYYRNKLLTFE